MFRRPCSQRLPASFIIWPIVLIALAGCADEPIEWASRRTIDTPAGLAVALAADGSVHPDTMADVARRATAPAGTLCAGSLRVAAARGTLYGAWWAPRPDSGVRLLAARSTDGGRSWSVSAAVDTTDAGQGGCHREAPAITADSTSGYVHVTYALQAAEGPGLFFSHSMDGGVSFHAPVPILYGERLGHTSVAADGDLVVVGFEDPNSTTPRIGLALSRTMGHLFEHRILPVSDDNDRAVRPLVAVRARHVAVAWATADGASTLLTVRTGALR